MTAPKSIRAIFLYASVASLFGMKLTAAAANPGENFQWLKQYVGKSTNTVVLDRRFKNLLDESVPDIQVYLGMSPRNEKMPPELSESVRQVLSGPPDDVIQDLNGDVVLSACRIHSCDEKGFLWIDTESGKAVGVVICYRLGNYEQQASHMVSALIYSRNTKADALTPAFGAALKNWLTSKNLQPSSWAFVGASGELSLLLDKPYSD